ncbi:RAMP superfamily CRISPR-associated protein [Actinophytocola sp. KF-1]
MKVTLVTVALRMETAGGVTAPEAQWWDDEVTATDTRTRNVLPLRRDPFGHEHIPGTTIAGALRAHCHDRPGLGGAFGPEPGATHRSASPIQVLGTWFPKAPTTTTHTRTAVDRFRGAPRTSTLRATEMFDAGTEFRVALRWNDAEANEVAALLDAVRSWAPVLGRGASIGAGQCVVTGLGHQTYDLSTAGGLMAWLRIGGLDDYPTPEHVPTTDRAAPVLRVTLAVVDALHVGAGTTIGGAHGQQVAALVRRGNDIVIPGSGLKGVLRSRAEYICRVLEQPACTDATCGQCRPCRIFGHGASEPGRPLRRAAVAVADAVVREPLVEHRQHVTVDRFTGGAQDELLFTHEVLVAGTFDLTVTPLGTPLDRGDLLLLDAVVLDLHDGLIGIGARTTAGYGTVRVVGEWTRHDLADLPAALTKPTEVTEMAEVTEVTA